MPGFRRLISGPFFLLAGVMPAGFCGAARYRAKVYAAAPSWSGPMSGEWESIGAQREAISDGTCFIPMSQAEMSGAAGQGAGVKSFTRCSTESGRRGPTGRELGMSAERRYCSAQRGRAVCQIRTIHPAEASNRHLRVFGVPKLGESRASSRDMAQRRRIHFSMPTTA